MVAAGESGAQMKAALRKGLPRFGCFVDSGMFVTLFSRHINRFSLSSVRLMLG